MQHVAQWLYRALAVLFLVGVLAEIFLAGLGVFRIQLAATTAGSTLTMATFDHRFHAHLVLGDSLFGISLFLIVVTLLARLGRREVLTAVSLFIVLAVQATFAFSGPADVRALHPLLAVLVLAAAAYVVRAFRINATTLPSTDQHRLETARGT